MSMRWYVARRVAWALVVAYVIVSITFVLLWASPTAGLAQAQFQAAQGGGDAEAVEEAIEEQRGLDRPVWEQYSDFIVGLSTGNWGWSRTRSQLVLGFDGGLLSKVLGCAALSGAMCNQAGELLGQAGGQLSEGRAVAATHTLLPRLYGAIPDALPFSMMYSIPSIVFSTLVGLGIGLYSAVNQYTKTDYAAAFLAFFGISIPNFWFGIVLILIFSVELSVTPVLFDAQLARTQPFSLANARQLVLPVVVLVTAALAGNMRYGRANALEYVNAEFVKTAKAKGADGRRRLTRHILRPALVPLSTILVGDLLGLLIAASYLIEVVFGIPGLGRLAFQAITQQDTALVLGTTFIPVFISVIGNLLQDLAYVALDPRIDYGDR